MSTKLYQDYSQHHLQYSSANLRESQRDYAANLQRHLPADRTAPILDFGCGLGHVLQFLQHQGYSQTTGIDISTSQIDFCHEQGLTQATLVDDSITFLQQSPNHYAAILAIDVFEHLPKAIVIPTLQAAYSALRPGGTMIIRVPNAAAAVGPWTRYMDFTHELSYEERSLQQIFSMAGFSNISVQPIIPAYRRKLLGRGFEMLRSLLYQYLRLIYFLQAPGTIRPTIFTIFIYGIGRK